MIELSHRHDMTADRVERILVMPHARRLPHTNNPDPRTPLGAKFSIQYCVARGLTDRAIKLEHFEGEAPFDPAIRDLMRKIEARPHPDMQEDWGTEVIVETSDGQRHSSRLDDYPSRGPAGVPMTHAELWSKFHDCGRRSLPDEQVGALFEVLMTIGDCPDTTRLTQLLQP
jgi:2-methylcitrate dehydratase PrpD